MPIYRNRVREQASVLPESWPHRRGDNPAVGQPIAEKVDLAHNFGNNNTVPPMVLRNNYHSK